MNASKQNSLSAISSASRLFVRAMAMLYPPFDPSVTIPSTPVDFLRLLEPQRRRSSPRSPAIVNLGGLLWSERVGFGRRLQPAWKHEPHSQHPRAFGSVRLLGQRGKGPRRLQAPGNPDL